MTARRADERSGTPFGWWPSPWTAADVAAGKVSRGALQVDGVVAYWSESRPGEAGRPVVVAAARDAAPVDVSPPGVSVRTRVHEYGGAAFTVADGVLYYSDGDDERLYRYDGPGGDPVPLTPPAERGTARRYADFRITPSRRWLVAVEESIDDGVTSHRLMAVATHGHAPTATLVEGRDFVAAPRPDPTGTLLAWTCWDHPTMPWDAAELWVANMEESPVSVTLGTGHRVSGGPGGSVGQPRWCRDGSLLFVDERSGWWRPARVGADAVRQLARSAAALPGSEHARRPEGRPLVDEEAEFHGPDWVLGQSTMTELSDGSVFARRRRQGVDELVRLTAPRGRTVGDLWSVETVEQDCCRIDGVAAGADGSLWVAGSTATVAQVIVQLVGLEAHRPPCGVRRSGPPPAEDPDPSSVAWAESFLAPGPEVPVPGLYFAPAHRDVRGPAGAAPPLVVFCHGGPTGSAEPGFDAVVQFFTSHGLAVGVVDYRGSTGYGRAYRERLAGRWGEADVDDCAAFAAGLAEDGRVDGRRMAIRGTSAGGLTALEALVRSEQFLGAAAWYGVTDLAALATDTHDFESRYLDSLVGPWPAARDRYRARSPLHHAAEVSGGVLLLQGTDDPVVPADQAERFAAELRDHGVPCRLILFPGESHGFRRAETIEACLEAELAFYRELFGPLSDTSAGEGSGGTLGRGA